jgi:hypothetical protein
VRWLRGGLRRDRLVFFPSVKNVRLPFIAALRLLSAFSSTLSHACPPSMAGTVDAPPPAPPAPDATARRVAAASRAHPKPPGFTPRFGTAGFRAEAGVLGSTAFR